MPLDVPTLFIVATCITGLLGLFLLVLWIQDRSIRALGWWAGAYLLGGFAVALWLVEPLFGWSWPNEIANALLFTACGMIWSGARMFRGHRVLPFALMTGGVAWLLVLQLPAIAESASARIVLSSLIIATYAALTAIELNRERRNRPAARVRAIVMPILHGAVFLTPVATRFLMPTAAHGPDRTSFALFALLTLLYVVGTAFIVVVMAKEHSLLLHKTASLTDPLTGLFNRRGFFEGAQKLITEAARKNRPVTVLMFDLDHFKSINDRFGHDVGDEALRIFATTASKNMRSADMIGRLGGEEFAAILPSDADAAFAVAQRVRLAFEETGRVMVGHEIGSTVSIGAAEAKANPGILATLITRADAALYRAKAGGRNRVIVDRDESQIAETRTAASVPAVSGAEYAPIS